MDPSPPSKEEKSWTHGYWCVAFLDLLGQREAFRKTDYVPLNANPAQLEAFFDAVRASVGAIRGMREIHARLRKGLAQASEEDVFAGLPPEKQRLARRFQVTKVREYRMSDGMILACPLTPEEGNVPLRGVYEIVLTCAAMMAAQLAKGQPIRGGIDVGTGIEIDGELFGASLVKAYEIESKVSQYPRIVVGQDLVNMLHSARTQEGQDILAQYERQLAEGIILAFKFDQDCKNILDYAGTHVRSLQEGDNEELKRATTGMLAEARAFADKSIARFTDAKDEKLAARYTQLKAYLDGCPE